MKQVTINGKVFQYTQGQKILSLLQDIGTDIPALCFDERVAPASVCRLCLVKVKDNIHLPACRTSLMDNMEIETHSEELEIYRRDLLEMLTKDYPSSAITQYPEKEFHKWLHHYGIAGTMNNSLQAIDVSHTYIQIDMSKCINCFRCVNVCDNLQGQSVWHIINRGNQIKVISDSNELFADSSCVSCGACSDSCPTGAIEDKYDIKNGAPQTKVRSVCAYCGVGCEIVAGIKEMKITGIHPVKEAPVNKGHLCVKGRYAWEYIYAEDRITHPMIKTEDEWKVVSWEEAIGYCAKKLDSVSKTYGPDSVGILGSARATNEDNYVAQKFARTVIGTNNVDNCARVCHQPSAKAMSMMMGTGAATNSFNDIERAHTILVAGANSTESHPVVGARIKQMVISGTNLIVIDPRKTELASYATCHLQLKPGTNIPLFNAMAQVIVEENLIDAGFIDRRIEGWEMFIRYIHEWTPERAAEICHIPPGIIRQAARLYGKAKPSIIFHGLGLTEHMQGTEGVMALVNLALLTGNIGKPGTGINPLRGQNNVQGSAAMGCDPSVYTGMASVRTERQRFERLWQTKLPESRGLSLPEMLDAAAEGSLKAMWITGYDVFFTMPDVKHSKAAFDRLDFLIIQDMFMNETAKKFADVFLPVASSFEKDGTFMNAERRIQKVRKVIPPPGNTKADWEIVCMMAATMGRKKLFEFSRTEEIWNEIRNAWSAVYGISYERLENAGIQWPCPALNHPGTEILHAEQFPTKGNKAKLIKVDFLPTTEQVSPEYPFILITGRDLYHFNAGTMTYRTPDKKINATDHLRMNPADAKVIDLRNGDQVKIISTHGETFIAVLIDGAMKRGEVFCTFSNTGVFINKVTGVVRDRYVKTPEYKITAVRIEKVQTSAS